MQNSCAALSALNHANAVTMSSREIADLTGKRHDNVMRDIRKMLTELYPDGGSSDRRTPNDADQYHRGDRTQYKFLTQGTINSFMSFGESLFLFTYTDPQNNQLYPEYRLPKRETLVLIAGYNIALRARIIDRLQELEDAAALSIQQTKKQDTIHAELLLAETAARMLNISSSGKLGMLKTIQSIHGLPNILPSYAIDAPSDAVDGSSRPTFSATELLRRFEVSISAKAFNMLLENNGLIKRATRPSTKAPEKQKEFWVITGKGLMYGKNVVDHRCPRETQPHWFESRFNELLKTVGLSGKAAA